ncbi:MAG: hypothetical protein Ct9H300mP11_28180 [Chloroflexota bacterium]|nr:MAG: hypothetical protein Ct9H300mP11_28180 [Chloroflexota bacterium]
MHLLRPLLLSLFNGGEDREFLGPAAFNRAFALVSDSRDEAGTERMKAVDGRMAFGVAILSLSPGGLPERNTHHPGDSGLKAETFLQKSSSLFRLVGLVRFTRSERSSFRWSPGFFWGYVVCSSARAGFFHYCVYVT